MLTHKDSKKALAKPKPTSSAVKYCSDRCRARKPGSLDRAIERKIASLLDSEPDSGVEKTAAATKAVKGDRRVMVTMSEIEELMFGSRFDPTKVYGRRKNRASRALGSKDDEWKSVDMMDREDTEEGTTDDEDSVTGSADEVGGVPVHDGSAKIRKGPLVRPPQIESEINGSIGGEKSMAERKDETAEALSKRQQGDKRADEREMVRRAARRAVVFGLIIEGAPPSAIEAPEVPSKGKKKRISREDEEVVEAATPAEAPRRKCEAIMQGQVVEPSFAKGDWSIRWRE